MKTKMMAIAGMIMLIAVPCSARSLFMEDAATAVKASPVYRAARTSARASTQSSGGMVMRSIVLQYADAKQMQATLANLISVGGGTVAVNEQMNALVIRAAAGTVDRVADLMAQMDTPPLQVQVESKILEVNTGSGDSNTPSSFGFSWQYFKTLGSSNFVQFFGTATPTSGAASSGLYAQVLGGNVNAYLSALEKLSGLNVIASPWISAVNHQQAEIFIGGKIGYRTLLTTTTGTLQQIDYLESGTKLNFTPHISKDGYIRMLIYPSVSEGTLSTDGLPISTVTQTSNTVIVKDGQTIVIGGLTKKSNSRVEVGVPYLSAIPFFGSFFKKTSLVESKRDIMVLITPHIVTSALMNDLKNKADEMEKKQSKEIDDTRLVR